MLGAHNQILPYVYKDVSTKVKLHHFTLFKIVTIKCCGSYLLYFAKFDAVIRVYSLICDVTCWTV